MNNKQPPRIATWLIKLFAPNHQLDLLIHNFEDEYYDLYEEKGKIIADTWYWLQTIRSLPKLIKSSIYWGSEMFKNYFKIAFRNIRKHKGFSFINIAGRAIGIGCSILIFLYVNYEMSYDKFHLNGKRIFRYASRIQIGDVKINQTYSSSATFIKALEDFPEIETGVKTMQLGVTPISYGSKTFNENRILAVDSTFFDVFTFNMINGHSPTALIQPNTMVITEETALKYFGRVDVIGEQLNARFSSGEPPVAFDITGVSETVPV